MVDIKTIYKDEIKKFQKAAAKAADKKKALLQEHWKIEQQIQSPALRTLGNDDDIFSMVTSVDPTTDELMRKYRALENKLSYPISYDPEYRAEYRAFLEVLQKDIIEEYEKLDAELEAAITEYKVQKAYLYNQIQVAAKKRNDFNQEMNDLICEIHNDADYEARMSGVNHSSRVDPLNPMMLTRDVVNNIKTRLHNIDQLDQEMQIKHDPEYLAQITEQELQKRAMKNQQLSDQIRRNAQEADPEARRVGFIRR